MGQIPERFTIIFQKLAEQAEDDQSARDVQAEFQRLKLDLESVQELSRVISEVAQEPQTYTST